MSPLDWLSLILGLVVPCVIGYMVCSATLGVAGSGARVFAVGAGMVYGLLGMAVTTYLWGVSGLGLNAAPMLGAWLVLLVAAFVFWNRRRSNTVTAPAIAAAQLPPMPRLGLLVAGALLLLLLGHYTLAAIEVFSRPIFPFDAVTAWATKARVWAHEGEIVPFLDKPAWLVRDSARVYTDHMPDYPIFAPLLQLWCATLIGGWDGVLVNAPWLIVAAAMLFLLAGTGLILQLNRFAVIAFTVFLGTTPLIDTHIALAGYSDLIMATALLGAVCFLVIWRRTGASGALGGALVLLALCPFIKNEGLFWAASVVGGAVIGSLGARYAIACLLAVALAVPLGVGLLPADLEIAGHTIDELGFSFHQEAVYPIARSMFLTDSWNITYWIAVAALLPFFSLSTSQKSTIAPLLVTLLLSHFLFFLLFTMTGYYMGAVQFTAVSRINMALVPLVMLFSMMVFGASPQNRGWRHA